MKRNFKRVVSPFTVMVILVLLVPFVKMASPARALDALTTQTQTNVDVDTLISHKVLEGYPDGHLYLDKTVTRAEFAKMIVRSFPYDYIPWFGLKEYSFKDTPKDFWASPYIEALARRHVVNGFPDGTFKPNQPVSLEEAVVILSKALSAPDVETENDLVSQFKDASSIAPWAKNYLNFMLRFGFVKGNPDGTLTPFKAITREEVVHLIALTRFPVITILHTNNFYMYLLGSTDRTTKKPIGGSARIATIVKEERAYNPNTLLVDAGNAIGGGPPIGAFFQGKSLVEVYNAIGYDVANIANHEFDWGTDVLKQRMTEAKYSYVSANLIDTTTHSTFAPPFDTKTFGFVKIAFTGVESTELPLLTTPDSIRGIEVIDPVKAINNYNFVDLANYTVALSHLYHDVDVSYLAPNVKGVNLIIGALPFTLYPYPEVVNGIPIVQTNGYGNSVGKVVLEFETTANSVKLLDTKYELIPINDSVPEDPTIKALLEPYNTQLKAKMDEVIGETLVDLERGIPGKPNLGDFFADWMRNVAGTDMAILNGGIMRAPILKGPITVGTVYTVLPFDNLLVKLEITGKQVVEALETGWSPQISGIRIKINSKNPPGSRVVEVLVGGQPIDLNKVYTVVVSSFQAAGGDAYTVFKQAISSKWVTGRWMRDDLVDYIKANPKVNVIPDGRITYVDP